MIILPANLRQGIYFRYFRKDNLFIVFIEKAVLQRCVYQRLCYDKSWYLSFIMGAVPLKGL